MGFHGLMVSTLDCQMCGLVLWWDEAFFLVTTGDECYILPLSKRVSLYANKE